MLCTNYFRYLLSTLWCFKGKIIITFSRSSHLSSVAQQLIEFWFDIVCEGVGVGGGGGERMEMGMVEGG